MIHRAARDGRENQRWVGQFYFDDRSGEVGQNSTDVDTAANPARFEKLWR
jgi:hypothetical protein